MLWLCDSMGGVAHFSLRAHPACTSKCVEVVRSIEQRPLTSRYSSLPTLTHLPPTCPPAPALPCPTALPSSPRPLFLFPALLLASPSLPLPLASPSLPLQTALARATKASDAEAAARLPPGALLDELLSAALTVGAGLPLSYNGYPGQVSHPHAGR